MSIKYQIWKEWIVTLNLLQFNTQSRSKIPFPTNKIKPLLSNSPNPSSASHKEAVNPVVVAMLALKKVK